MTERMRVRSSLRLQGHLNYLGVSERELARQAGLSHATVNFLVHGTRLTCSRPTAEAIERALQVDPGELFAEHASLPRPTQPRRWPAAAHSLTGLARR